MLKTNLVLGGVIIGLFLGLGHMCKRFDNNRILLQIVSKQKHSNSL